MNLLAVVIICTSLLIYSLVSERVRESIITAPMIFAGFGLLIGDGGLQLVNLRVEHETIHTIAELTLILVLFTDAARIDLSGLFRDHNLPARMLLIGLPLTIVAGALVAIWLFPELLIWEAALLAALLAPTDAALGQAVISIKAVPTRIRQALNVESGLNDGIALPAVLLFAAMASMESDAAGGGWGRFIAMQLTLGPVVGIALGYAGGRLIDLATNRKWADISFQGIAILTLAVLTYAVAEAVGGNGFIAAFVGGMVFGHSIRHACNFLFDFMENEGQLLMLVTFFVFGAALLPEGLEAFSIQAAIFAALSLTVIRMLPVAVSLAGSGVCMPTKLFLGWFGPRGLASILFVLLILEESSVPHKETLLATTVITVAFSILLHGLTAAPLAVRYGEHATRLGEVPENKPVSEMRLR
jgi:NhaP-type Na+/H+ or K+/H+ antiporter